MDKSGSSASMSVTFSEFDQKRTLTMEDRLARVAASTVLSPPAPIASAIVNESKSSSEVVRNSTSPSSSTTVVSFA